MATSRNAPSTAHRPLTSARIAAATPSKTTIWLSDDHGTRSTGRLLLRISPSGVKRFYWRFHDSDGDRLTLPIGLYSRTSKEGYFTLQEARLAGRAVAAAHESTPINHAPSKGPNQQAKEPTLAPPQPLRHQVSAEESQGPTLIDIVNSYVKGLQAANKPSGREFASVFRKHIEPSEISTLSAASISPEQITNLIRKVSGQSGQRTAAKVRSILYTAYKNAAGASTNPNLPHNELGNSITRNPVAQIRTIERAFKARTRTLQESELKHLWSRLQGDDRTLPLPIRALRVLLLTGGQRGAQLFRVELSNVDLDYGTILLMDPKGRRTVPRPHLIPLTETAKSDVRFLHQLSVSIGSQFLFSSPKPKTHLLQSTVSQYVAEICRQMRLTKASDHEGFEAQSHFQCSDLRRTAETMLARLGVSKDHRAHLQSHGISGVQDTHYDFYSYFAEKKAALELWEKYLNSLLEKK